MRIIPAIDIIEGKCVRLSKGDYATKKIYNEDPLEVAREFEANGIRYLHLVDLDGAKSNTIINYKVLEQIAAQTNLIIDFGGGIKTEDDLNTAFACGANQVTVGSIAANKPERFIEWLQRFGPEKIILGADCLKRKIATNGWLGSTSLDVIDFIANYEKNGIQYVICTDIDKDGQLAGTSVDLYRDILSRTTVKLIASGGITTMHDLEMLQTLDCDGSIIGKAIYEGKLTLKQLQKLC